MGIVQELDYTPSVVTLPVESGEKETERVDLARLPDELQDLLAAARRSDRHVLFDFSAPG